MKYALFLLSFIFCMSNAAEVFDLSNASDQEKKSLVKAVRCIKSKKEDAYEKFRNLLTSQSFEASSRNIEAFIALIFQHQQNKYGGMMLEALWALRDVDFNTAVIPFAESRPITFAVYLAEDNARIFPLIRALIRCEADPRICDRVWTGEEYLYYATVYSNVRIAASSDLKKYESDASKLDTIVETEIQKRRNGKRAFNSKKYPLSARLYGVLLESIGRHAVASTGLNAID